MNTKLQKLYDEITLVQQEIALAKPNFFELVTDERKYLADVEKFESLIEQHSKLVAQFGAMAKLGPSESNYESHSADQ